MEGLTLNAAAKLFFRLVAMLMSRGSRQVIMAIPAVRFLIIWCAATRIRDSSESKAKSFLMICSQVVMAILIDRSTTGCTSSWTARSTDCRTHCFNWGCACSKGIWGENVGAWIGNFSSGTLTSLTTMLVVHRTQYVRWHLCWYAGQGLPRHKHWCHDNWTGALEAR